MVIFMKQPPGFEVKCKENFSYLLKKSLYRLKQSRRQCYIWFNTFIQIYGFKRCSFDNYLYYCGNSVDNIVYLLLYADDMLIPCKHKGKLIKLKTFLQSKFDMKGLGFASRILRINILRNRDNYSLIISQKLSWRKLFQSFLWILVNLFAFLYQVIFNCLPRLVQKLNLKRMIWQHSIYNGNRICYVFYYFD